MFKLAILNPRQVFDLLRASVVGVIVDVATVVRLNQWTILFTKLLAKIAIPFLLR